MSKISQQIEWQALEFFLCSVFRNLSDTLSVAVVKAHSTCPYVNYGQMNDLEVFQNAVINKASMIQKTFTAGVETALNVSTGTFCVKKLTINHPKFFHYLKEIKPCCVANTPFCVYKLPFRVTENILCLRNQAVFRTLRESFFGCWSPNNQSWKWNLRNFRKTTTFLIFADF